MNKEFEDDIPEVEISSEDEADGDSEHGHRPESPPKYQFREDRPVTASFAVDDIMQRRREVEKQYVYMVESKDLFAQSSTVEGAVHCYNEAAVRYHGMMPVARAAINPTSQQEQLIKNNIRTAKKNMDKLEELLCELQILAKLPGRSRVRNVRTQTPGGAQGPPLSNLEKRIIDLRDTSVQTYEKWVAPVIERVIVEVPIAAPPRQTGEISTQTEEICPIPPPAFCGLGIQPTQAFNTPPVEELVREFGEASASAAPSHVDDSRSRETSQARSTEAGDLIELHDNMEFMDVQHRPSTSAEGAWGGHSPAGPKRHSLNSEVHKVPNVATRQPRPAPHVAEELDEIRIAWEEFKEQYELLNKSHWKFSQAWRQYYVYVTGKWSGRRPPIRGMNGRCRYCFILDQKPGNHDLHNCPYWFEPAFGGPVHPCERYVWVEVIKLCHNCFSPSHPTEKCLYPSHCKCVDNLCQCEVNHSHSPLICGSESVSSVDKPPKKKPKSRSDGAGRAPPSAQGHSSSFFDDSDQRRDLPGTSQSNERKRERSRTDLNRGSQSGAQNRPPTPEDYRWEAGPADENPFRRRGSGRGVNRRSHKW